MVLVIAYDLHNPGRDYEAVADFIKSNASWAHPQGSVWFVQSSMEPEWWVRGMRDAGDANDEYFVCQLAHNWSSINMDQRVVDWLKSGDRSW